MSTEHQIKKAYLKLAPQQKTWICLADLRNELEADRQAVNAALKNLYLAREINLTLEEDQKRLTAEQREAAIGIGATWMHYISI